MRKQFIWFIALFIVLLVGVSIYKYFDNNRSNTKGNFINEYKKPGPVHQFAEEYDVIVVGGEPEGIAAAVSAARNGANTLLIEKREELGGLFTYGMLNFLDIPQGEDGKSVSRGIYKEWHELVGGGNAFGILEAKAAFKKLVDSEKNITLTTETDVIDVEVENNVVVAIKIKNKHGEFVVNGKSFIDATQDADFAIMSNVPYFIGGEDIGIEDKKMAVTLMMHLKNVDWKKIKETAKSERFGPAEVTDSVAWGFSELHYEYKPVEENTRLRGLNLVKLGDEYFINALQIFGVDGLNEQSKQTAIEKGKKETNHILDYLKKEFPGFEEAEVISYPTELYVRETRHIKAEYQLPMSDVWTNRDHWDSIGFGAYPVDVQAQTPQDYGYVISAPKKYAIPFRSLIPLDIDGLLVVGRSAGYSSLAAGSARVVPTGMMTGEAAGVAAVLANGENISFRELSKNEVLIEQLREKLTNQGAYVDHYNSDYPYQGEWYDQSIQTLIDYGLVVGGYTNELYVEELAKSHSFINMLKGAIARSAPDQYAHYSENLDAVQNNIYSNENGPIKNNEAANIVSEILFGTTSTSSWDILLEKGIIDNELAEKVKGNRELLVKEMYAISAAVINYLNE